MSGYTHRNYVPWKSNLPSSYKNTSSFNLKGEQSSRLGSSSISPTTAYRPSYSSGTYRSSGIKRDTPTLTTTKLTQTVKDKNEKITSEKPVRKEISTFNNSVNDLSKLNTTKYSNEQNPLINCRNVTKTPRIKSRDPSPSKIIGKSRSRDPSPNHLNSSQSTYSSSYRLSPRNTSVYSGKYGRSSSFTRSTAQDRALSYMSSSDLRARSVAKQHNCSNKTYSNSGSNSKGSSTTSENRSSRSKSKDEQEFFSITVITRATSPTPPSSSTSFTHARHIDLSKTIKKTLQKSVHKPQMCDKDVQTIRLDEPTKYSNFGTMGTLSTAAWSAPANGKLGIISPKFNSGLHITKNSRELASKNENEINEKVKGIDESSSRSLSKTSSSTSYSKIEKSITSSSKSKSSTDSKCFSSTCRQRSSDISNHSNKALPPIVPKADSPIKSISSTCVAAKWPNKDFRKSALNIGPTDRSRKSRTPSIGTDTDEKCETSKITSVINSTKKNCLYNERSPSVASESSSNSIEATSRSNSESDVQHSSKPKSYLSVNGNNCEVFEKSRSVTSNIIKNQNTHTTINKQKQPTLSFGPIIPQVSSQSDSSSYIAKNDESKSHAIHKLGSVSNFFVLRTKDCSGETIYLDGTSSTSKSQSFIHDITKVSRSESNSNSKNDSITVKTDTDDESWWQNTSRQINTESALNVQEKMKYKLRHIDSVEDSWNVQGHEDDTFADDLKTLNDQDLSECTDKSENNKRYVNDDSSQCCWSKENIFEHSENRFYKLRHVDSGEPPWWMVENNDDTNNQISDSIRSEDNPDSERSLRPPFEKLQNNITVNKVEEYEKYEKTNFENSVFNNSKHDSSENITKSSIKNTKQFPFRRVESGEKAWWMQDESSAEIPNDIKVSCNKNSEIIQTRPIGDRASPEGLEDTSKSCQSFHDIFFTEKAQNKNKKLFISHHTNIDELLGGTCQPFSTLIERFSTSSSFLEEIAPNQVRIHDSTAQLPVIHRVERDNWNSIRNDLKLECVTKLDDAALQIYKDGDYGAYLDLESSLAEQAEEIDGLNSNRKNSLVLRTQLSVRVHSIIEKLLSSEGSELRRALFSLKQIFQEDKDLVHGFVAMGGLNCLVQVGNGADQNYQNYILRALGQVMLYVDGMNGVMKHDPTIQWLYSLISSKYRLVVKTSLKLLLVFVEYIENNCYLLVNAIHTVDNALGVLPWSNIMKLLKDYENADTELLIYATSLINKTLSGLSDQDSFYDESDFLEQQGMEGVVQRYMSRPGTDLDLLDQLQLYEAVLKFEDGESDGIRIPDSAIRKTLRHRSNTDSTERRKSRRHSTGTSPSIMQNPSPSKTYTPPINHGILDEDSSSSNNSNEFSGGVFREYKTQREGAGVTPGLRRRRERAERHKTFIREQQEAAANGFKPLLDRKEDINNLGQIVTAIPILLRSGNSPPENHLKNQVDFSQLKKNHLKNIPNTTTISMTNGLEKKTMQSEVKLLRNNSDDNQDRIISGNSNKNSYIISEQNKSNSANSAIDSIETKILNGFQNKNTQSNETKLLNTLCSQIASLKNKHCESACLLAGGSSIHSSNKQSFSKHNCNENVYSNARVNCTVKETISDNYTTGNSNSLVENEKNSLFNKNSENENVNINRKLKVVDSEMDNKRMFVQIKRDHTVKDLTNKLNNLPTSPQEDKTQSRIGDMTGLIFKAKEGLAKSKSKGEMSRSPSVDQDNKKAECKKSENELHWEELVRSMDRPLKLCDLDFTDLNSDDEKDILAPRGLGGSIPPPPPPSGMLQQSSTSVIGILPSSINLPPPPTNLVPPPNYNNSINRSNNEFNNSSIKKNKKTVKLFWKEVREDMIPTSISKTIWDELPKANVDVQKLEHLFESRAKDLITKKQQELNKNKEIIVLDHKRSNAINIAMTKLPPPRAIKAAILKMDATVVTREGIDKLLNMQPTEEERGKIQEAQITNPELPLGSAEQFLLTLSSISELAARLKLWAFKLDFENSEKEIAEPLMDLKQGLELLKANKTFKCILSTLLSVGIFLNGTIVKGFQIEYLAKVPEVKDTVHKHSLLHHLCYMVMETSPDTTDLYSEIGPITRASKADFTELAYNLNYLETECKASWDRLKLIAKHDCPPHLKQKLVDFLAECAERIILLQIVHRRVMNRYKKFLLWLGVPQHRVPESKPNDFCRIVSEFALEYRTTRERVHQQLEKKASHRERNKTRGKMIIDVGKFRTQEDRADAELKQLLGSTNLNTEKADGTLTWRRRRADYIRSSIIKQTDDNFTDGDDEIIECLVKTATKAPGSRPGTRERKRTRNADRKSLRRTLKNGLTEEEKQHVASLTKTY